jgi:hypothetical protein
MSDGVKRDESGRFLTGGKSPNPNGKPQGGVSVVDAIKRELDKVADFPNNKEKRTYLELLIDKIMKKAVLAGDVSMIKDIINRIDGMPKQPVEMSGSVDTRLEILTRMGLVDDNETKSIEGQTPEITGD